MQTLSLLLILLLYSFITWAQPIRGGAGFLYGGQIVLPGSARMVQQQSQTVVPGNDQYALFGAETYVRVNRWLVGLNVSALVNKPGSAAGSQPRIESSASNAHIWVGWVAWQSKRAKLYPSLGPGINAFNINATKANGAVTTTSLDGFSTDIGLTFDWLVAKPAADPMLLAGPMLSVRAGYRRTTASAEWHGDSPTPIYLPLATLRTGSTSRWGLAGVAFESSKKQHPPA
ncbi:MAG: hypothetical protein LH609_21870 [Rudanella sp.]|nr:hypothetical protein [Rudanella sp.]